MMITNNCDRFVITTLRFLRTFQKNFKLCQNKEILNFNEYTVTQTKILARNEVQLLFVSTIRRCADRPFPRGVNYLQPQLAIAHRPISDATTPNSPQTRVQHESFLQTPICT